MFEYFIPAYVTLFVIMDPLGTAAVFLAMSRRFTPEQIKRTAIKASSIAVVLMITFGLLGEQILDVLGISLPAFRVAGGMLLFVTAFRMVMGAHGSDSIDSEETVYKDRTDIAVFPLAIPLLCGPGCMTASILLMNEPASFSGELWVLAAMLVVQATGFVCLRYAPRLNQVLGNTGVAILARVMGVVLAAMAIQFITDGLRALVNA